jgi:hypothetical protein
MLSMQRTIQPTSSIIVQSRRQPFRESPLRLGMPETHLSKKERNVRTLLVAMTF